MAAGEPQTVFESARYGKWLALPIGDSLSSVRVDEDRARIDKLAADLERQSGKVMEVRIPAESGIRMSVLSPKPGDIIVLKVDAPGNSDMMERAKAAALSIRERYPDNFVAVLPEGCDMVLEDEGKNQFTIEHMINEKIMAYMERTDMMAKQEVVLSEDEETGAIEMVARAHLDRLRGMNPSTQPKDCEEKSSVKSDENDTKTVQFREWL